MRVIGCFKSKCQTATTNVSTGLAVSERIVQTPTKTVASKQGLVPRKALQRMPAEIIRWVGGQHHTHPDTVVLAVLLPVFLVELGII